MSTCELKRELGGAYSQCVFFTLSIKRFSRFLGGYPFTPLYSEHIVGATGCGEECRPNSIGRRVSFWLGNGNGGLEQVELRLRISPPDQLKSIGCLETV